MNIKEHKNVIKVLNLTPWLIFYMVVFSIVSIILNILDLFDVIDPDNIRNTMEDLELGIGCFFMFLTLIIVIIYLILYIKIAISMLNSRNEMKELEKDGNIAGIMLLSVIPAAVIGNVPYVGDVIRGFFPILYIGAFIVYYRKILPVKKELHLKISIGLLIILVVLMVTASILNLITKNDVTFIIRILAGIIGIALLIQIYRLNEIVRINLEKKLIR